MRYTLEAWREDEYDSEATEGFYQWASMAFEEYYFSGWKDADAFGTLALVLAHWILYIHEWGRSNAGFAYEGLISALRVAQDKEDVDDEVLTRLRRVDLVVREGGVRPGTPLAGQARHGVPASE